jgi:hypothetical protein
MLRNARVQMLAVLAAGLLLGYNLDGILKAVQAAGHNHPGD